MKVEFRGLDQLESYFRDFPDLANAAARLSINSASRYAARLASKHVRAQVAFKRSYIGAAGEHDSKIRIKKFASSNDLEAVIAALDRPTSLARFSVSKPSFGRPKSPPRVRVKTGGGTKAIKKGFFVRLKRGKQLTEDHFNIGLAVRLKEGEKIQGSQRAKALGGGVYLLYGPSVAQVFNTVREDIAPGVADFSAQEFFRQFGRLARG